MKTNIYYILSVFLFLFACASSEEEKSAINSSDNAMTDSISVNIDEKEIVFTADSISDNQFQLFSKRAEQKLQDYYGYLKLLSDTTLDNTLKEHILNLISKLKYDNAKANSLRFSVIKDVKADLKIEKISDTLYKGAINYLLLKNNDSIVNQKSYYYIAKRNKTFGDSSSKVWEILLEL